MPGGVEGVVSLGSTLYPDYIENSTYCNLDYSCRSGDIAFYLFHGNYTPAALEAMVDNPHDRVAAARGLIESIGGTLHHFFFRIGKNDLVALIEAPDDAAMATGAMAVGASGALSGGATTKLLTSSEAMAAMNTTKVALSGCKPATG